MSAIAFMPLELETCYNVCLWWILLLSANRLRGISKIAGFRSKRSEFEYSKFWGLFFSSEKTRPMPGPNSQIWSCLVCFSPTRTICRSHNFWRHLFVSRIEHPAIRHRFVRIHFSFHPLYAHMDMMKSISCGVLVQLYFNNVSYESATPEDKFEHTIVLHVLQYR